MLYAVRKPLLLRKVPLPEALLICLAPNGSRCGSQLSQAVEKMAERVGFLPSGCKAKKIPIPPKPSSTGAGVN